MKILNLQILSYHSLKPAMQPSLLVCSTTGHFLKTLLDIAELLEPLKGAINEVLIPAVTDHTVTKAEHDLFCLPVCIGGLGFTDPVVTSSSEYEASIKVTNPLVRQIVEQEDQPPDASEIQTLQLSTRKQKDD